MKIITVVTAFVMTTACSKAEPTKSKPATCDVAGKMVTKRLGEFADKANVTGERRIKLDQELAATISARCTEDKWDDVPLGCLGALATIPDGKITPAQYADGVDICTKAIGDANWKKMEDAIGPVIRAAK